MNLPKSYDLVGDILISTQLIKKQAAQELLKRHNNIKVVLYKSKQHSGKYRTPQLKIIAGEKRKETVHKESGIRIKVNPEKTYFSPRTGTERLRVAKLVKKKEDVLIMFSGVMPFGLIISKHSKAKSITGIEHNPTAHKYAQENIQLNKVKNIKLHKGDVKRVLPKLKKFDRIIMPHPTDSEKYLKLALKHLKTHGRVHLYVFEKEENFKKLKQKYKEFKPKLVKAGSPAPGKFRVCLDLKT